MNTIRKCSFLFLIAVLPLKAFAQSLPLEIIPDGGGEYLIGINDAGNPCISPEQYRLIEAQCAANVKLLHLDKHNGNQVLGTASAVKFNWPLKTTPGFSDCSYYAIFNYVDQDQSTGTIKDYNCGSTTYDGHAGTDIGITPFPFYKMDHDQIQVIAAATGTIVAKVDGNFDKNCAMNNLTPNYIVLRHADGSSSIYYHMKKNSLTSKMVGQTVAVGEFLGTVGSSGNSTAPHLHFEVWSGGTYSTRTDPFSGTCNSLSATSWWAVQPQYTEPAIIKASVHTDVPIMPACPNTETPYEDSCYAPNAKTVFAIFIRNETKGLTATCKILNPDGTIFSNWIHNSTSNYIATWWYWYKTLPSLPGTYTFETTYNGITCSKRFDVAGARISSTKSLNICSGDSIILTSSDASSYLWNTGATTKSITVSQSGDYSVSVKTPMGCSATSPATTVTVVPLPVSAVIPNGSLSFCKGDSVILSATAATSYSWSNGDTTQQIVVSNPGKYFVTITNSNGCSATSDTTIVQVIAAPIAVINPSGSMTLCEGDNVTLTADPAKTYLWSSGANTRSITVSKSGTYFVKVTNDNGCMATSSTATVTINPLPVRTVTQNGSILISDAMNAEYQWLDCSKNFAPIAGATSQTYTASSQGSYAVRLSTNGCYDTSACYTISTTGINNSVIEESIRIYPNPTIGKIIIETTSTIINAIKIYNILGENIFNSDGQQIQREIDISGEPGGIYYMVLNSVKGNKIVKIVKY